MAPCVVRFAEGAERGFAALIGFLEALGVGEGQVLLGDAQQEIEAGTGRLLQGMLVGTGPADVVTLVSICLVLITVAVMACFWPARKATRLDPVKALRYQ